MMGGCHMYCIDRRDDVKICIHRQKAIDSVHTWVDDNGRMAADADGWCIGGGHMCACDIFGSAIWAMLVHGQVGDGIELINWCWAG